MIVPFDDLVIVFDKDEVIDTVTVEKGPLRVAYNPGCGNFYRINGDFGANSVSVIAPIQIPFEDIITSDNKLNIQVQENTGNNVGRQSGLGNMYSDLPILQGQSTDQDSQVISYTFNKVRQKIARLGSKSSLSLYLLKSKKFSIECHFIV